MAGRIGVSAMAESIWDEDRGKVNQEHPASCYEPPDEHIPMCEKRGELILPGTERFKDLGRSVSGASFPYNRLIRDALRTIEVLHKRAEDAEADRDRLAAALRKYAQPDVLGDFAALAKEALAACKTLEGKADD